MTKIPFSLTLLVATLFALMAFALGLSILYGVHVGAHKQLHLNDSIVAESQIINDTTEYINNEKALQFDGLYNKNNQFMINEFKNIHLVKA